VADTDGGLQVTLTANPPAAVEEGGSITLTAGTNRAVLAGEDATVRLTVVGPVVEPAPSTSRPHHRAAAALDAYVEAGGSRSRRRRSSRPWTRRGGG